MAVIIDRIVYVSPDTDESYALDCSDWSVIANGDTVAGGAITWEPAATAPSTYTPSASSPNPDQYLHVHVTGFVEGTTYLMRAKITTTGNAVEDFYVRFICGEPTGF